MNKNGPIIIVEDDHEDQEIISIVFKELNYRNKIVFFDNGLEAIEYLRTSPESPFLVLSDINMPMIDGFALRSRIFEDERLRQRCIPYLFFTTAESRQSVIDAYSKSVQGFFKKPANIDDLRETLRKIIEYWKESISPGRYEEVRITGTTSTDL